MRSSILITAVLVIVTGAYAASPAGVNLAELDGWDIVIPADSIPSERYAAEELQGLLQKATGKKFKITDKAASTGSHFYVGAGATLASGGAGLSTIDFGPEAFRIVIGDGKIAILGGRPRGTLYGVYAFAEDYLGVRFLTADHTYVPPVGPWRVVGPVSRFYDPPLRFRWSYYGENNTNPVFAARRRCNTTTDQEKLGGKTGIGLINHTFGAQIPSGKYGKEHPEYFALVDGKRRAPVEHDWHQTQPCTSNPEVLRIVTEAVLADLKAHPDKENISVSQNDNEVYCRCPDCAAIDAREESHMGALLTLVNGVADAVAKQYPKVMVGTLSYQYSRKPPKLLKPRPNVQIQLCSIECCQLHAIDDPACPKNRQFCADMLGWGKICRNVSVWSYYTNFSNYLLPMPNFPTLEPNVRFFVANQADGVFMQAAGNAMGAEMSDLRNYVISGLLWDPNRSGPGLMDEFLRLHYGKAAPPIREFITLVHENALAGGEHPHCFGAAHNYAIDKSIAKAGLEAFAQAMKLADDDAVRERVEKASICAYRAAIEPVWRLKDGEKMEPALAERMRPLVKQLLALCAKHKVTMFNEHTPMSAATTRLKGLFGVAETQEF